MLGALTAAALRDEPRILRRERRQRRNELRIRRREVRVVRREGRRRRCTPVLGSRGVPREYSQGVHAAAVTVGTLGTHGSAVRADSAWSGVSTAARHERDRS